MSSGSMRLAPDVSNARDMVGKLLGYVQEELAAARKSDDLVIRIRHLERGQVFLDAAVKAFRLEPS